MIGPVIISAYLTGDLRFGSIFFLVSAWPVGDVILIVMLPNLDW